MYELQGGMFTQKSAAEGVENELRQLLVHTLAQEGTEAAPLIWQCATNRTFLMIDMYPLVAKQSLVVTQKQWSS